MNVIIEACTDQFGFPVAEHSGPCGVDPLVSAVRSDDHEQVARHAPQAVAFARARIDLILQG